MVNKKEKVAPKSISAKKKPIDISLVDLVVKGMQEKKAHGITIIDLKNVKSAVADYFILCSANTDTQVDAIRSSIEEEVYKACGLDVWKKEGMQNREWILLDYADVVAHIFRTDRREFYGLEDLWGDADIIMLDDETSEPIKKPKKEITIKPEPKTSKKIKAKPNVTVAGKSKSSVKSKGKKPATKKLVGKKVVAKKSASPKKKSSK